MIPNWVFTLPYVEGGRDRSGVDCWGLIIVLYQHYFNVKLPDYSNITLPSLDDCENTSHKLEEKLLEQSMFEEVEEPKFGDVVILKVLGYPIHIGFVLDSKRMIHTGRSHGVTIEKFTEKKWINKIVGFYRMK